MEGPCSRVKVITCGEGGGFNLFLYICFIWLLTFKRCFGDVERREAEESVFVTNVASGSR
jgi:hypothetical protein